MSMKNLNVFGAVRNSAPCLALGLCSLLATVPGVAADTAVGDASVKVTRLHSFAHDVLNTYGTYSGRSPSAPPVMGSDGYLYGLDTWGGNALPWLQSVDHFTYKMRPVPVPMPRATRWYTT